MSAWADRWNLPSDGSVRVVDEPPVEGDVLCVLDTAPPDLLALVEHAPILVPKLRAVVGEPLVSCRDEAGRRRVLAARDSEGRVVLGFHPQAAVAELTSRRRYTPRPPVSARLPVPYRRVPGPVRRLIRNAMVGRAQRSSPGFPAWPVEPSVEALRRIVEQACRLAGAPALNSLWPEDRRYALLLTHDIDSRRGLDLAPEIAAEEEARGLRSCWYVVGADWTLDETRLQSLDAAGHEIGLHDAHHDNRGPFLEPHALGARLETCKELIERFAICGYRSPSMLRTPAMYEALESRFSYDSSIPDTGMLPMRNGCATVFPLDVQGVPVLPLTVPPDGQLLGLGLSPDEIVKCWIAKIAWIARVGGVAMVLTHPEPGFSAEPPMRAAYRRFLDWAASQDDAWQALPRDLAAHWALPMLAG